MNLKSTATWRDDGRYNSRLVVIESCRDARSERPSPLRVTTFRPRSPDHSTTDAQTVRPYRIRFALTGTDALRIDTTVRPYTATWG